MLHKSPFCPRFCRGISLWTWVCLAALKSSSVEAPVLPHSLHRKHFLILLPACLLSFPPGSSQILSLFFLNPLFFLLCGMWDLNSLAGDQTHTPCSGSAGLTLTTGLSGEVPKSSFELGLIGLCAHGLPPPPIAFLISAIRWVLFLHHCTQIKGSTLWRQRKYYQWTMILAVFLIAGGFFTGWATREALMLARHSVNIFFVRSNE